MNLSISDVTLEELTILCSRIGEISINECIKEEKAQEIKSYVDSGMTEKEAVQKQEQVLEEKVQEILNTEPKVQEEIAPEQVQMNSKPEPESENLTDKLTTLASEKFANQGRTIELVSILREFGVNAIPELDSSQYPKLYERLSNA